MIVGNPGFLGLIRYIYQAFTTFAVLCGVSASEAIYGFYPCFWVRYLLFSKLNARRFLYVKWGLLAQVLSKVKGAKKRQARKMPKALNLYDTKNYMYNIIYDIT